MPPHSCDLCGLTLRHGVSTLDLDSATYRFCCPGCRQVFSMLMEASDTPDPRRFRETDLFRQCVAAGVLPASEADLEAGAAGNRWDGPPLRAAPAAGPPGSAPAAEREGLPLNLRIEGMWCPACAWVIARTLDRSPGVTESRCDFSTDALRCRYDPVATSPERIVEAVERMGYRARRPGEDEGAGERRAEWIRFGVSAFLTANVMMLAFALYSGFFTALPRDAVAKLSWPMFVMASVVFFYGGRRIHQKAWAGVASAAPGMETLVTLGAGSAYLYSTGQLFAGSIHLYYDTASMLITLVLLGKRIESGARAAIREDLGLFFAQRPTKARIVSDTHPRGRYVHADQLRAGDRFRVVEDEIVPADGTVLDGEGLVDESSLTGESLPARKSAGEPLTSGTRVLTGSLTARAARVGDDSTLGQMLRVMEASLGARTPLEERTDRILLWFVPLVTALAAGTAAVLLAGGHSAAAAVMRAITVLVISCPCALGIAIPLARVAGICAAAGRGILVRNFAALSMADHIDAFVFDKTGTLTEGRWRMLDIVCREGAGERRVLAVAAGLEEGADHHVAREIRRQASRRGIPPAVIENRIDRGNGFSGEWRGRAVAIGPGEAPPGNGEGRDADASAIRPAGETAILSEVRLRIGGETAAVMTFGDRLKAGARETVAALRRRGFAVLLVSGDGEAATREVAAKTAIADVAGGCSPRDKRDRLLALRRGGGRVAMVGDGVNDAPALAASDLAIAVHSGHHLGKEAADITLMSGEPSQILVFLDLAGRVNRKVMQNLCCSLVYNLVAIPVAVSGLLTPLVAVSAMILSSLSVTGNTLLLIRKEKSRATPASEKP